MKRGKISVTPDQMSVVLRPAALSDSDAASSVEDVKAALVKQGVVFGVDLTEVEDWLASASNDELVIAKGRYSKNGRDGYLKFLVDVTAKPQFVPDGGDGSKTVDYRNAMRMALVEANQKLAEIILPTQGENGTSVLGSTMAPSPGNPTRVGIGEGVELRGNEVYAKVSGSPSCRENVVAVRKVYEIPGDVSFSTGNINFPGTVIVKGDVLDEFEINAQENVIVQGLVNASKITAGGYIHCIGGIFGKGKAEIRANGVIETRFADSCILSSDSDITVAKDILHCKIFSLGQIKCAGSILGGEAMAMKGVEASEIGSDSGSKTTVAVRKHYRQEKAKEMITNLLDEANDILESYRRWAAIPKLSPDDVEALDKSVKQVVAIIQKKKNLDLQIDKFERLIAESAGAQIKVAKMLWADVVLAAPYCKYMPVDNASGPLIVTEDVSHGTMLVQKATGR
jgi:uncharacterized protein (DUF342 family)